MALWSIAEPAGEVKFVLISSFPAGPWQTNCYVIAPSPGAECIVIDPGHHATRGVQEVIREKNLKPIAVLVTHGHLDHMWSVLPVADGYQIPALIHGDDRHLLADPISGLSEQTKSMLPSLLDEDDYFADPSEVLELSHHQTLSIAGIDIRVLHAPGHTQGSAMFECTIAGFEDINVFTGDVLFAGAIGRTDLTGGSPSAMNASLRDIVLPMDDRSHVWPGHGPSTSMARERVTNEYLLRIAQGLSAT